MHILIVGGTGTAGRVLTRHALIAGHRVRVLTRTRPSQPLRPAETVIGNLTTGDGLTTAVRDVDAVVDLSNTTEASRRAATHFFTEGTRRLFAAETAAGVRHHLTLSIVGVDALPSGYYQAKLAQERAVQTASQDTGIGHTIARVTQFHDFAATTLQRFRVGPIVLAPALQVRPVHLDDVAEYLLRLLDQPPAGFAEELGGPHDEQLDDMTRRLARATGRRLAVLPAPLPRAVRRANQAGVLRPSAGIRGGIGFDQWLQEQQR